MSEGLGAYEPMLGVTKEFDTEIPAEYNGELLSGKFAASVEEEFDRFIFHATFEKGQLAMLQCEQGDEVHRYYISTASSPLKAMCCGSFLESDERVTKTNVDKIGLKGEYDLRVIVDDKKYDTGIKITC